MPLGLGQAVTVRVGVAYGARDHDAIARAGWSAFGIAMVFMSIAALVMITVPHLLISAFLDLRDPDNARVIALAVSFLAMAAIFQIVDGAQAVGAGMLRGLQDTRIPMLYAGFGYWLVGMPIAVGFGLYSPLAGVGVWMGLAGGLTVVAILFDVALAGGATGSACYHACAGG